MIPSHLTQHHDCIPIFINCRERLTPLLALLSFLERAGHERIFLIDNDSTYPPLLEFYAQTCHKVIRLGANLGHEALWVANVLERVGVRGSFVLSDPDIVPLEGCPLDVVEYFGDLLERYPDRRKVGFGLAIDDLPREFVFREEVIAWESYYWQHMIAPGLFDAPIDTTFALYRDPGVRGIDHCLRTGHPYLARHIPWYENLAQLSEEERFYRTHARKDITNWSNDELPPALLEAIRRRPPAGTLPPEASAHPAPRRPAGRT
ncbi:MAG: hypothetical protein NVSMB32_17410 [Actinomycetota bacterium]